MLAPSSFADGDATRASDLGLPGFPGQPVLMTLGQLLDLGRVLEAEGLELRRGLREKTLEGIRELPVLHETDKRVRHDREVLNPVPDLTIAAQPIAPSAGTAGITIGRSTPSVGPTTNNLVVIVPIYRVRDRRIARSDPSRSFCACSRTSSSASTFRHSEQTGATRVLRSAGGLSPSTSPRNQAVTPLAMR